MEAKIRIPQDPALSGGLEDRLVGIPPGVAALFREMLASGEIDDEPRLLALMTRQARRWEIKATLLEVAQGALTEEAYWPAALAVVQRLFAARHVTFWADRPAGLVPERRVPDGPEPPPAVGEAMLREAIAANRVQTATVPDPQGAMRLCLLGPLAVDQGLEGVLEVELGTATMSPDQADELTEALCHLAAGIASVRRFERLAYHASHDPLTGLANRRTFEQFVDREFKLTQRHGTPVSLMVVDVDHFKAYNDTYGHPAGDELLKVLAAALGHAVRSTDFIARLGGEEFVIVLPHTAAEGAVAAAEKVLHAIRDLPHHHPVMGGRVTASIGVASCDGHTCSVESLLESADQAMYRAKRSGRDQVCQA